QGVAANAGQSAHLLGIRGEDALMFRRDLTSRPVQVAGTAVVAQPFPEAKHFLFRGGGQRRHGRERLQKTLEIRHDRRYLRLLEHDLADPDGIRVAALPPRQVALVASKPGQQLPAHAAPKGKRKVHVWSLKST